MSSESNARTLYAVLKWVENVDTPEVVMAGWHKEAMEYWAWERIQQKPSWVTYSLAEMHLKAEGRTPSKTANPGDVNEQ